MDELDRHTIRDIVLPAAHVSKDHNIVAIIEIILTRQQLPREDLITVQRFVEYLFLSSLDEAFQPSADGKLLDRLIGHLQPIDDQ